MSWNGATGVPGALSNQPPSNAQIPEKTAGLQGSNGAMVTAVKKQPATTNWIQLSVMFSVRRQYSSPDGVGGGGL